jgi:hypothetical protein
MTVIAKTLAEPKINCSPQSACVGAAERCDLLTLIFKAQNHKIAAFRSSYIVQPRIKAKRSALIVAASVVGIPCGNPGYDFNVPLGSNFADIGPEFAYGTI